MAGEKKVAVGVGLDGLAARALGQAMQIGRDEIRQYTVDIETNLHDRHNLGKSK